MRSRVGDDAMKIVSIAALLLAFMLAGCAGAQFRLPEISDADVNRASLTVAGEADNLPKYYRTAEENRAMVNEAAARLEAAAPALCAYAHAPRCTFDVVYVADDTVNAETDGRRIAIYRGLIQYLDSEEEVAAVIGHEIGHEIAQHVEEKRQNAMLGAVLAGILMGGAMVATGYQDQDAMSQSMQFGAAMGALSFSKEEEREADLLSAYLLARANYDLHRAGRVWVVLSKLDGETHASMFDTHPAGPERVAAWEKAIVEVEASPNKLPQE
jgi:predicted Zn-dependent protease